MASRYFQPIQVLNQTVSGNVDSNPIDISRFSLATFEINFAAGLNASFTALKSQDGVNYIDSGLTIGSAVGSAGSSVAELPTGCKYVKVRVAWGSGSGNVTIYASAKESGSTASSSSGASGPTQFIKNGSTVTVNQDTGTPANNRFLPVTYIDPLPAGTNTLGSVNVLGGNLTAVKVDGSAVTQPVSAASLPLPAGAATAAKQPALGTAGTPSTDVITVQGAASMTALKVDGSAVTQPVSAASLPLPTGAATSALQTTGNTSLSSIDGKLASLGQKNMLGSEPVVIASDQSAIPASQSGTWNITNVSGTVSLPTGAATSALQTTGNTSLSSLDTKLPAKGQAAMSASTPVVIASDQSAVPMKQSGTSAVTTARNDYTGTNVTTSAYVQLVASTASAVNAIEIFDSSGQTLYLATGGVGSEVNQIIIFPGGNGRIPLSIPASTRISIKAISNTANSGEIDINFYS